jgi:uncharacterized membrane protein
MKKAVVSLAAVIMLMASLAPATLAGPKGTSVSNANGSLSLTLTNDVVSAGDDLSIRATLSVANDGTRNRKAVAYRISVLSADGFAFPINARQGVKFLRAGASKSMSNSFEINERARPGDYMIRIDASIDGAPLQLELPFTVVK